ncbi:MAG: lysoplasmalogenase [bacterium]|nr:lysoplasmalogenase [bacterium]
MTIFIIYMLPVVLLSALSIASRRFYPATEGRLSSAQYRVAKTPPVFWILGFYGLWYYGAGGAELGSDSASLRFWVMVGLIAGVAGDFFLLFRRLFLPGFTAFALGHILYLYGFATVPWVLPIPVVALIFVPGLIYAPMIIRRTERKDMLPLILFYMLLINGMLLTAINASTHAWLSQAAAGNGDSGLLPWGIAGGWIPYCLTFGAGLFCVSDACWAWNRFVRPFANAGLWILATYYGGQALIVWGAMQYPL